MAINQFNYLDIGNLIINELIGNFWVALILAIIIIVYFSSKNNLPNIVTMALVITLGTGITAYYYSSILLTIIALILGILIYGAYSKWLNR